MKTLALISVSTLLLMNVTAHAGMSDDDLIKSAEAAAPAAVSSNAAIYAPQVDGSMKTLREGKNGWWCMPDDPATPGTDPMCGDANSMAWAMAWMGKTEPPKGKIGLMYMLMGGTTQSNLDPYAAKPPEGIGWNVERPHIMIVNAGDAMAGYPTNEEKPDNSQPYVMWGGTPYAHLMVPVQ